MQYTALIVDDNVEICELYEAAFASAGFDAYSVTTSKEAVEFLSNNHVDVMTLDHNMPGMSGLQLLRFIKETHIADDTKIMMATADETIIFDNEDIGLADLVMMKPIGFKQLVGLASRLITSPQF